MNANYFVNNQGQIKKYKKGEKSLETIIQV